MKGYVGITDGGWYRTLRSIEGLVEVNFWQPSGGRLFRVLHPLEPFFFKLHHPDNFIVGGAFFAQFSILPMTMAWEAFGHRNGVTSLEAMRERISKYKREPIQPWDDPPIGCIALTAPFFFDENEWIPVPPDFAKNIVQGKSYDLTAGHGLRLWSDVQERIHGALVGAREEPSVYGREALVKQRLGQGTFRVVVTETYERRCAVTGEKALPALEAAHIKAVSAGGMHRVDNGILLRSDVHTLYDRGYLTITPDLTVRASERLHGDFNDGESYRRLDGSRIWIPNDANARPSREALEWHADVVFKRA